MSTFQYIQFAALRTIINTSLYFRRSSWMSPATQPDKTKIYRDRTDLFASRIFIPRDHGSGDLPLVIQVHGGGFMLNNPSSDDPLARQLADEAKCIVVSIDYRKAPQTRFPGAYEDVVSQVLAVIEDAELPIDRTRVVLVGSSAGGNLILAAAQDGILRKKLLGVLALYPVVDFGLGYEERMATRPDAGVPDFVGKSFETVRTLYLGPQEQVDVRDVRLSPGCFGTRGDLPWKVLIAGAEHCMFCHEARVMAERLAQGEEKVDVEGGWKTGDVRWWLIKGQKHAFDHIAEKDSENERLRAKAKEQTYGLFVEWLKEVFEK